ncbi:hypothetical protein [Hydrogenophaga sp. ANAO-22]|uniref:hypothetical protein n=1 Tax=Hydrogenophaga sp. ANAO-22 TaxID=3166645 RepID=UPI0036D411DF
MENTDTYHLVDGVPTKLLPKEWDRYVAAVQGLEAELREQFASNEQGYAAWLSKSVSKLPAGVFVWLDEFTADFEHDYGPGRWSMMDEREGDRDLKLSPYLEDAVLNMALEGFERRQPLATYSSEDSHAGVVEFLQNKKLIDWRYWVENMKTLGSGEAARLMQGLDPDLYHDLGSRPVPSYDATAPCAAAKSIERLATTNGLDRLSPEEWCRWAMENNFRVHRGFFLAGLGRYLKENEDAVLASMPPPEAHRWKEAHPVGGDMRQVSTAFAGHISTMCRSFPEFCAEVEERLAKWRRGRYTLVEAAQVIADLSPGLDAKSLSEQMDAAIHAKKLTLRLNNIRVEREFIPKTHLWHRDLFQEDVNAWLADESIGEEVRLSFPYLDELVPTKKRLAKGDTIDFAVLATRDELIAAFGAFTGMNLSWFKNLSDTPALKAARRVTGQGQRGRTVEPLFCPFEVMQWLISPKRKKGRPLGQEKAWERLEQHFPKVYALRELADPR